MSSVALKNYEASFIGRVFEVKIYRCTNKTKDPSIDKCAEPNEIDDYINNLNMLPIYGVLGYCLFGGWFSFLMKKCHGTGLASIKIQ